MSSSSIAHLPKLTSVKRTIRKCKSVSEISCGNPTCAAEIQIPQKYKVTLKDEAFLLYDSGYGKYNRMIIFLLLNSFLFSKNQIPGLLMGHLKLFRNISSNYILYTLKRMGSFFPVFLLYYRIKSNLLTTHCFANYLKIKPDLNPKTIMVDFEKAAIHSFENNFNAVISGCFFHLSQNIWGKIQSEGLTVQYQADGEFQIKLRMLMGLAFVPERDVSDCFISLMVEFPTSDDCCKIF